MGYLSLFRSLKWGSRSRPGAVHGPGLRQVPAGRRRSFVPTLDILEDRTVPSTFTVTNINDSGAGSLRQAIIDANAHAGADQVAFASGLHGTIMLTTGQLSITDTLTINGPGSSRITITGRDTTRVFDIGRNLTVGINGLTVTHGKAADGGAIRNAGVLTLSGDVVSLSQANGAATALLGGGGIENLAGASLILFQTTVSDNKALGNNFGGGILNEGRATLVLAQSTLSNNQALSHMAGGGGLENLGTATITNSVVSNNRSPDGAGVSNDGTLNVADSSFIGNVSDAGMDVAVGAALINSSIASAYNSTFSGNVASGSDVEGGGIANFGSLTLTNSTVSGNVATAAKGADGVNTYGQAIGGGVLNFGSLTLDGSSVGGNLAKGGDFGNNDPKGTGDDTFVGAGVGGGIANVGSLTITNSVVSGNESLGGNSANGDGGLAQGGGVWHVNGTLFIQDSTVAGNSAIGGSGADNFRGGIATGGGIDEEGSELVATGLALTGNSAIGGLGGANTFGGTGFGGGLSLGFGATASLSGSTIQGNLARGGDGGFSLAPDGSGAGNGANAFGGGIGVGEGTLFGLTTDASSITVDTSMVSGNVVQGGNGGFLDGNGGNGQGGGVFADKGTNVMMLQTTVSGNEADGGFASFLGTSDGKGQGGGVYVSTTATVRDDLPALISGNNATTSNNDVFGPIGAP